MLKILILWAVLPYGWIKTYHAIADKKDKEIPTPTPESLMGIKNIDFETDGKDAFWNKKEFFDISYINKKNTITVLDESTILLFDGGWYFYLMIPGDVKSDRVKTINHIREKLWKYQQFKYLLNGEFAPTNASVTNTFNIRPDYRSLASNSSLTKNPFWVPIPLDKKVSKISNQEFYVAAQKAIDLLPTYNKTYWEIIGKILKKIDKKDLSKLLTTVALLETGQTTNTIWSDEYHRREEWTHNCFSFWPQHVLMEWPWINARMNLKCTELQTYHPIISNMLCLWFLIEKIKWTINNDWETSKLNEDQKQQITDRLYAYIKFIDGTPTVSNLADFATFYNWDNYKSNDYDTRFIQAYTYLEKSLKEGNTQNITKKDTDVVAPKNPEIQVDGFKFLEPIKKDGDTTHYIYSYTLKKNWTPKDIIATFTNSAKAFKGKRMIVTDAKYNKYNDETVIVAWKTVRLKVKIK